MLQRRSLAVEEGKVGLTAAEEELNKLSQVRVGRARRDGGGCWSAASCVLSSIILVACGMLDMPCLEDVVLRCRNCGVVECLTWLEMRMGWAGAGYVYKESCGWMRE